MLNKGMTMKQYTLTRSALCVSLALTTTSAFAANSWLSRVNTVSEDQQQQIHVANYVESLSSIDARDTSQAVFDITVSLYNNPQGNEKLIYDQVFANFADAVCEQSNGEHKLGKISVFRENKHRSKSDIIWGPREWPRANASGFGANGMHIWFGDIFPNGAGAGLDHNMLQDPVGAGYTLAHEWGHYAYGVFDEYRGSAESGQASTPLSSDIATQSIMSNQWKAKQGDFQWVNHSTKSTFGDAARTAQGRVYGKSAWEVLLQNTKEDPKSGRKTAQPKRIKYTALANNAPDENNPIKFQLPNAQASCQDQLEIVWVEGDIDMQVVIDRSGSMAGTPINNAKQAAKILVDATAEGSTALGLVSFSSRSSITQDFPIQKIDKPDIGVKAGLKAAVDNIRAGGSTALYDASQIALDNLVTYQSTKGSGAPGVVFVLADGDDNSSRNSQANVINNYQAANIPVFSFGYGSASPTGPLLTLANSTGGKYFSSPTSLAEIIDAFLQANAIATDNQNLISSVINLMSGTSETQPITVDSGLDNFNIFINHGLNANDIQLSLFDSNNIEVNDAIFDCMQTSNSMTCSANISSSIIAKHGGGEWQLHLSNSNLYDTNATINVSAEPSLAGSYTVTVEGASGNAVNYPAPMIITTAITKDKLITGANVVATIKDPAGSTTTLEMLDNGLFSDATAGDGIYTAIAPYNQNGIYQVEVNVNNNANQAKYTTTGLLTPTIDGSVPEAEALPDINENFVRISKTTIVVSDVPYSDGDGNTYNANPLNADNSGAGGVIDSDIDLDYYLIKEIDITADLVVRVTDLSLGMKPNLSLYKSDGTTIIAENITLSSNPSKTDYVYYKVDQAALESEIYALVKHEDPSATVGGYQISAGKPLNTDTPPNSAPETSEDVISLWSGQIATITPLDNDTDADGDDLVIDSINTDNTLGVVTLSGDSVVYDATTAFSNEAEGTVVTDSFKYIVTDNKGAFVEETVNVTVNINSSPTAVEDIVNVAENETVVISPLVNDSDVDGHNFGISSFSTEIKGKLTDNNDSTWLYSPDGQFDDLLKGEVSAQEIKYTIVDELGATSSSSVKVNVIGVNTLPHAEADSVNTSKSKSVQINVLVNDFDSDNDTLSVSSLNVEGVKGLVTDNGDGTVTYDPNGQFNTLYSGESATESFSYTITDGEAEASGNVTITISGEGVKPTSSTEVSSKEDSSSGGSLYWLTLLLMPIAVVRRRKK